MKKLINDPARVVPEMLEGLVALEPGLALLEGETVVVRADAAWQAGAQVAFVAGGGSGHEPAHAVPRRDRSSYLGERAIGQPDPGAVAVAIWLEAAARTLGAA